MNEYRMRVSAWDEEPLRLIFEPTGMEYVIPAGEVWIVQFDDTLDEPDALDNRRRPEIVWHSDALMLHAAYGGHIRAWNQSGEEMAV